VHLFKQKSQKEEASFFKQPTIIALQGIIASVALISGQV
jgi:hypothetical protein